MAEVKTVTGTLNDEKQCVDLYIPRKCVYTNKILDSRDRSSVQISIA
jgi:small subunit ribosomal protein S21e